jgi:hypothetical protein
MGLLRRTLLSRTARLTVIDAPRATSSSPCAAWGRIHDLRHVAGSLMLANGYPVVTVAAILGHKTRETTMRVYAHAIPKHVVGAPRNIADILPYDQPRQAARTDPGRTVSRTRSHNESWSRGCLSINGAITFALPAD